MPKIMSDAERKALRFLVDVERSRRSFWDYCNVLAPDFYLPDRGYLYRVCMQLQDFLYNDVGVLIVNAPPRHGKSRTAGKYVEWVMGKDPTFKIMTGSYNETLSTVFSSSVRDTISASKVNPYDIVYSDIFPDTKIKRGDAAKNIWSLEGSEVKSYLATSPTGTATGFGADMLVIDDIIKSAQEANTTAILAKHWDWFTNTMYSRLQGRRKILIIMTQWATKDLAHRAAEHFRSIGEKVEQITLNALQPNGRMLDKRILPRRVYDNLAKTLAPNIFSANYKNVAVDLIDGVYGAFKTYKLYELPERFEKICSQTDTADEGGDYLCKIIYGRYKNLLYMLDVYYTQEKMEVTEIEAAKRSLQFNVQYDDTESNNGGKGFARNVERKYKELGGTLARFSWEAQKRNKEARILTNATGVNNTVVMPCDWATRWPAFYNDVTLFSRTAKNEHDDGPDCLTRCYEKEFEKPRVTLKQVRY